MRQVERELLKFEEFRKTPDEYPVLALLFYALGISYDELSKEVDIARPQLSAYASGRLFPSVKVAKRIQTVARHHGILITLDEIFRDVDENEYETRGRKNRGSYDEIKSRSGIGDGIVTIRRFEEMVRERGFSAAGKWLQTCRDEA